MITHQPKNYLCPFCHWQAGNETDFNQNTDIVFQSSDVTAFIAPRWWVNNPGHVLVIPNKHYENIYDIPETALSEVYKVAKRIAMAIRATYECTGTSMRQHNEPDGNQDVWHFHVHVYPRYNGDRLYQRHDEKKFVGPDLRRTYAEKLVAYLNKT